MEGVSVMGVQNLNVAWLAVIGLIVVPFTVSGIVTYCLIREAWERDRVFEDMRDGWRWR